jgi:hypothetical protein
MKTKLKVIVLSVLVATSVHAKESKGIYFGLGIAQSKVIKFTSCFPMVGGSLWVLRLLPPLKLVAMI